MEAKQERSRVSNVTDKDDILLSAARDGDHAAVAASHAQGASLTTTDKKGRTALHLASQNGHYSTIKLLLQNAASVEAKDDSGRTPLALALEYGHCEAAWCLQKGGAKVSRRDHKKQTILHLAVSRYQIGSVLLLLSWSCNIDARDEDGRTPLATASRLGNEVLVELLLLYKADATCKDNNGWTALHFAVSGGYVSIASLLVDKGSDLSTVTNTGDTISSLALRSDNQEMIIIGSNMKIATPSEVSEESAPSVEEANSVSLKLLDILTETTSFDASEELGLALARRDTRKIPYLIRMGARVDIRRGDSMTSLMAYASWGDDALVQFLLSKGASLDATDYSGRTALWWAVSHCIEHTTKTLLQHGARADFADSNQLTPLMIAAVRGRNAIAQLLVQHGADVNSADLEGRTPLWWAIEYGQNSMVGFLLIRGARLDVSTNDGAIALCTAALAGHGLIVKLLLEHGAGINALDAESRTALHNAAIGGHEYVVEILLNSSGVMLDLQDIGGRTALLHAVDKGNGLIIQMLIGAGAQKDLKDKNGLNALNIAVMKDNEVAEHLLSAGIEITEENDEGNSDAGIQASGIQGHKIYEYQKLAKGSRIRILTLHPGKRNDNISFELNEVDLADGPTYEALSYEWGARVGTIPVKANGGKILRITPNLKEALRRLRLPESKRILWIDAICINQKDSEEKNRQVPMMTDIYRNASLVVLWIGDQDEYTQAAFSAIPILFQVWQFLKAQPESSKSPLEFDIKFIDKVEEIPSLGPTLSGIAPYSPTFTGLENIFLNTFFSRAWILQEIMLASQAVVLSGRFHCGWDTFRRALIALFHCKDAIGMPLVNSSIVNILKFHDSFKSGHWYLQRALTSVMLEFKASNPRDKIYAVLGLAQLAPQSRNMVIVPDYNASVNDVYINAARDFILASGKLDCWGGCNIPRTKQIPGLPSWVPDWTVTNRITFGEETQVASRQAGGPSTLYSKANLIAGQPQATNTTLFVNGSIIDKVKCKIPFTIEKDGIDTILEAVAILESLECNIFSNYPVSKPGGTQLTYLDVLWRTLQWDADGETIPSEDIIKFLAWKIISSGASSETEEIITQTILSYKRSCERLMEVSQHYERIMTQEIEQRMQYSADLIVTEKGCIGIVASGVAEEDLVVALLGGAKELSLLREIRNLEQDNISYEFADEIFMDHWRGPVDALEDIVDDVVIERLKIC